MGFLINVSRYADEVHGVFDDLPRNANDNNNVPLFALIFLMSEDKYSLDLQMRRQPAASSLPNINIHQFLKIFCHLTSFSLALKLRLSGALNHGQNKLRHTHRMNTGILCCTCGRKRNCNFVAPTATTAQSNLHVYISTPVAQK